MHDLVLIEEWYLTGMGARMIAAKLATMRPYRISRQQVQADLKKLDAMWKAEAIAMRDAHKRKVLAEIDHCYRLAYAGWVRSVEDAVRKSVEKAGAAEGDGATKQRIQSEGQCGDPRFLAEMRELRNQKIKLLGLDEPTSVEVSGNLGWQLSRDAALEKVYGLENEPIPIIGTNGHEGGNGSRAD